MSNRLPRARVHAHVILDPELRQEVDALMPRHRGFKLPFSTLVEDLLRQWVEERKKEVLSTTQGDSRDG